MAVLIPIVTSYNGRGASQAQRELASMQKQAQLAGSNITAGMLGAAGALDRTGARSMAAGKSMTVGMTLPAAVLGKVVWDLGTDYNSSMKSMQAASNASAGDMKKLGAMAEDMGYSSMFAAQDAAAGMLELSKSGITPTQMKAGALRSTMLLAAAGELELGSAAESVANTLNMFGLRAGQAGQVANALAGGANASSASVDSLRQGLAQVGPGARNAGLNLQTTVGILAAFANKGIQGSDAGTSLKTMLSRLIPTTDQAAKAMERYGLDFTDAKGRILPMTQVADQLKSKLGGLTMEQRNAALATIFGSDATRAATVLMQEGGKGLKTYIKATSDRTAASKMAAAQETSDAGQTKQAIAALKTAAVDAQRVMAPMVRDIAKGIGSMAQHFGRLSPHVQKLAVTLIALLAAAGPVLFIFGGLLRATAGAVRGVASLTLAFGKGSAAAPKWARAIAGGVKGVGSLVKSIGQGIVALGQHAVAIAKDGAAMAAHAAKQLSYSLMGIRLMAREAASKAAATIATIAHSVATKASAAAQWLLNAALTANPIGIVVVAIAALVAGIVLLWKKNETFRTVVIAVWNAIKAAAVAVWNFLVDAFKKWGQYILIAITGPVGLLVTQVVKHWGQIKEATQTVWNAIKAATSAVWGAIKDALGAIWHAIVYVFKLSPVGIVADHWQAIRSGVASAWGKIKDVVGDMWERVVGVFKGAFNSFLSVGSAIVSGIRQGISNGWGAFESWFKGLIGKPIEWAKSILHIGSPSRVFAEIGGYIAEGLAVGMTGSQDLVRKASQQLAGATIPAFGAQSRYAGPGGGLVVQIASGAVQVSLVIPAGMPTAGIPAAVQAGVAPALVQLAREINAI